MRRFVSVLVLFAVAATVLGVLHAPKEARIAKRNETLREALGFWLAESEGYSENKAYFDRLLEEAHTMALEASSDEYDDCYVRVVFESMENQTKSDNRPRILAAIEKARQGFVAERDRLSAGLPAGLPSD